MTARHPQATPSELLAIELNRRGVHGAAGYCAKAGVSLDNLQRAITGHQVNVDAFLRLCAALQYDPMPEIAHPMIAPGIFQPLQLAMAFTIQQGLHKHEDEQVASKMGCKPTTVRRIKWGGPLTPSIVLKACKYMHIHVFYYVAAPQQKITKIDASDIAPQYVSRETSPVEAA